MNAYLKAVYKNKPEKRHMSGTKGRLMLISENEKIKLH